MSEAESQHETIVEVGIAQTRRDRRLAVVDLLCSVGRRCSGEVVDLSESGVCVRYTGGKHYAKGDFVGMALRRHDVLVLVKAEVMWVKSSGVQEQVVGFHFDQTSNEELDAIKELVANSDDAESAPAPIPKSA